MSIMSTSRSARGSLKNNLLLGRVLGLVQQGGNENDQIMERSSKFFPFRDGRIAVLARSSNRRSTYGRRTCGKRSDRFDNNYHSFRPKNVSAFKTSSSLSLFELPEHDETMVSGKNGKRIARLKTCNSSFSILNPSLSILNS
jgi:hypothetical protein